MRCIRHLKEFKIGSMIVNRRVHLHRCRMQSSRTTSRFLFLTLLIAAVSGKPSFAFSADVAIHAGADVAMNLETLKAAAFARCQSNFVEPIRTAIPALDPPRGGSPSEEGLVFQEELAIRTSNILDQNGFYVSPRPRAAVNWLPMKVFVEKAPGLYEEKTWEDAKPDFSAKEIQPTVDLAKLPIEGRQLTEVIFGHQSPKGDFPQLFDIRSSAYVRFAGYPPQVTGASLRLGADNIFGKTVSPSSLDEDFPIIREVYLSTVNRDTAKAFVVLENKTFCAALELQLTAGDEAVITVDGYWYTREDFAWQKNQNTGFVAYSSMMFKNENDTPERDSDEAHDSDRLRVQYQTGPDRIVVITPPSSGLQIRDYSFAESGEPVTAWSLDNTDRNAAHYADFASALGATNYDARVSYRVEILDSSIRTGVRFYEHSPDGEYGDNIVALSSIREDIKKALSVEEFVRFHYRTTAYYPARQ